MSPNYEYVLGRAISLARTPSPRILDFGCGRGEVIKLGRERGIDVYGVDRPGNVPSDRLLIMEGHRIPFDDNSFDVVISNQVFEHVADPPKALAEISRVLKPGAQFLALFPDNTSWFEGHVGLYFVHWMPRTLAHRYMMVCHRLGLGYYQEGRTAKQWADFMLHQLETDVFYHSPKDLQRWWQDAFGAAPSPFERDFMMYRLEASPSLSRFARWAKDPLIGRILSFICRKRAGIVWLASRLR